MMLLSAATFFVLLSACQARSAKREEGGYIFLVVFCCVWCHPPLSSAKKATERPIFVRYQKEDDRHWYGPPSMVEYQMDRKSSTLLEL